MKIKTYNLLGLLALLLTFSCNNSDEESIKPTLGEITQSVYASVIVQPEDVYEAYTAMPGILEDITVEEGDTVNSGQLIAMISADATELNIKNALLNVELAKDNYQGQANELASLEQEILNAKNRLSLDSVNYFRQLNLWQKGIGAKAELDNKQLQYDFSKNTLVAIKKQYRQAEINLANAYKQAKNNLAKAQSNLKDFGVKAKFDGRVYAVYKEEGELVTQQTPLVQIGRTNDFIIEMLIDEVDIASVQLNQVVYISLDAYPEKVFEARITKIYPLKDTRTQTFTVEGIFKEVPSALYAGLSGEANIVIGKQQDVLTIPLDYLVSNTKVLTEDGEIEVEVGARNLERIVVISGVDSSTVLLKP